LLGTFFLEQWRMFNLTGKTALATGAATGLGQAIAMALACAGAELAVTDRECDSFKETEALLQPFASRVIPELLTQPCRFSVILRGFLRSEA
jgi:NAD(P)-dependent dehydrogenase (short-subunit alcohol dehydrogenase family)